MLLTNCSDDSKNNPTNIDDLETVYTDFYTYTPNNGGYAVSLSNGFRAQLYKATGGEFISGGITWRTGDPLPNPAPSGKFNGVPVVSMKEMFAYCHDITSLNVSNFNTSNVTDMSRMFYWCHSLRSLDLSNFNTSKVTDMNSMFSDCDSLRSLELSNFNTKKCNKYEQNV